MLKRKISDMRSGAVFVFTRSNYTFKVCKCVNITRCEVSLNVG